MPVIHGEAGNCPPTNQLVRKYATSGSWRQIQNNSYSVINGPKIKSATATTVLHS